LNEYIYIYIHIHIHIHMWVMHRGFSYLHTFQAREAGRFTLPVWAQIVISCIQTDEKW